MSGHTPDPLRDAAPDMLEALKWLCEAVPEPPEKNCSCHIAPPCGDCVEYDGLREALKAGRAAIAKAEGN